MPKNVVIDHDITGWGEKKSGNVSRICTKIVPVRSSEVPRREQAICA